MASKQMTRRQRIHRRIRKKLKGTAERPRMTVYRSNSHISVQLINDIAGTTLVSASSKEDGIDGQNVNKSEKARLVGGLIAKKAIEKGINTVVFDRGGYLYHGRIKALAEGARGAQKEDGSNELLQF
ncbi:50S ribosomal protein L18 [Saprospira grandis]